jgi:Ca-activated chloride channel family protein
VSNEEVMNDATMQALWLKRVQTQPADFLRAKFSYQNAMQQSSEALSENAGKAN